jgi:hypothetical protein
MSNEFEERLSDLSRSESECLVDIQMKKPRKQMGGPA